MSQANLHTRIETALREYHLCAPGDCLIVAVSGGADSVALLDLLASTTCYSFRLIVAHLNHLLRKEASNSDEQFVKALAERYGLPCEVARVEVNKLAQTQRLSLEEAGRLARYAFLKSCANAITLWLLQWRTMPTTRPKPCCYACYAGLALPV